MKCTTVALIVWLAAGPLGMTAAPAEAPIRPALLVIDIQNQFLPMMQEKGRDSALWYTDHLMKRFREKGFPVILVYHTSEEFGPAPESEGFRFTDAVTLDPKDIRVVKTRASAFKDTELDKILKEKGCDTLILTGLSAVGCVLATYFGAAERDYTVMMAKDALLSHDAAYTDMVEDICEVAGYDALMLILKGASLRE